ncbi:D-amino-acid oxidase [Fusarium albosuccineum]|uniref:D-amino-acid oxidase n=1 Tax=Fusarium albosuccineum TaxID=1237068 RepID=A0A8H4P430_9HYPO|nr:D-amino-acid oxidase [Fusarium albosuccineum]
MFPAITTPSMLRPGPGLISSQIRLQRRNKDKAHEASGFHGAFSPDPWFKSLFDDFRELDKSEVAAGYDAGYGFTTVCISTAIYLPWLLGQCARNGVIFRRARLSDISEAQHLSHTGRPPRFVVNCTGLGALRLGGVNDTNMAPCRGQTILVRNNTPAMLMFSGTEDGPSEETYVMQRAVGGGTILGGTYEPGNWDPVPDPNSATRIMKRVVDVCPEIAGGKGVKGLDVVRHAVGFRPFRAGGVRVEKEKRGDTWIIHNYGHDSWGYLGSYGCAEGVVELLNGAQDVKSRL